MSTWYYLVCDRHRVVSEIVGGRSFPDRWWTDNPEPLAAFLADHADCEPHPRLLSEHAEETDEYDRPYEKAEASE